MKQVLILRTSKEYEKQILEVLKMLLGNAVEAKRENELFLIESQPFSSFEVLDTIKSLEQDLNTSIASYICYPAADKKEYELIKALFLKIEYGFYDLKTLLLKNVVPSNSADILRFILQGSGVTEDIILAMARNDMNVTKASSYLYLHRNTLLYKIDKLIELKGFDLKSFFDLHILVCLTKAS